MSHRQASRPDNGTLRRKITNAYPFAAIVGQDEMKLALLLNVIDPLIGGVLIMGHRGTGKSTAVRALADLLPQVWAVADCHYGCDPVDFDGLCDDCFEKLSTSGKLKRSRSSVPVVTLPLGATEDRVCGTIDIERALREGVKAFESGLLARANRGFLYVDEVNLLEDHLVDLLLDVAVTGRNKVEREGISHEHPARFVLVGSGNPEEGELRPQLVDRFGLCAQVETLEDLDERVEIVELREAFENDPSHFRASFESEQQELRRRLERARKFTNKVLISKDLIRSIAGLCLQLKIDGHRGELTIARAARALAAFNGRRKVTEDDIRRVAKLSLRHRLRKDPLEPTSGGGSRIERALDNTLSGARSGMKDQDPKSSNDNGGRSRSDNSNSTTGSVEYDGGIRRPDEKLNLAPPAVLEKLPEQVLNQDSVDKPRQRTAGEVTFRQCRGGNASYNTRRGRYSRAVMQRSHESKTALDATLRATAIKTFGNRSNQSGKNINQPTSNAPCPLARRLDLRFKLFKQKRGTLFIMAIDTSGSMAVNRIDRAKGALVWLLGKSYIGRDRVSLVGFRGDSAEVLLPPSQSMTRARRVLDELLIGGTTPMASAMAASLGIAIRARQKGTERIVLLVFTDGRANVPMRGRGVKRRSSAGNSIILSELDQLRVALQKAGVTTIIVDTQNRFTSGGEGRLMADRLGADYILLPSVGCLENPFTGLNKLAT